MEMLRVAEIAVWGVCVRKLLLEDEDENIWAEMYWLGYFYSSNHKFQVLTFSQPPPAGCM